MAENWHFYAHTKAGADGTVARANHSTAGAQHAHRSLSGSGQILAYLIAGHRARPDAFII